MIEDVEGMSDFFRDGVHLFSFGTPEGAAMIIVDLLADRSKLASVKMQGQKKIEEIIRGQIFWKTINASLGELPLRQSPNGETM